MSIPGAASPLFLATTGAAGDFSIDRSLRFNSGDSSYLSRQPSSAGNRNQFTFSFWVKRAKLGTAQDIFSAGTSGTDILYFTSGDALALDRPGATVLTSTQVFRDVSSWYHIVLAVNAANGTNSNKAKLYVNGSEITDFSTDNRSGVGSNSFLTNTSTTHRIGVRSSSSTTNPCDIYLAEANLIDGTTYDPTSFGAFDDSGVWQATDTAGLSFGTNGFRLKFDDASSNAALGTDSSGNSNTWTVNNLTTAAALNPTAQQNFNVVTWTGNSSSRDIATTLAPDFVWIKSRSHTTNHVVYDVVRGPSKVLYVDAAADEGTSSTQLTAFNSNSFSLGAGNEVNQSGRTYVAWYWRAGGAASSNTDGSITTSVSANAAYGFSVVSWTGVNNASAETIGHGLGAVPKWVIVKNRTDDEAWAVYHESIGNTKYLNLDSNSVAVTSSAYWNNTSPTSSVITLYNSAEVQRINRNYVAYVWSEVAGFSKFSGYTGTGSSGQAITGLGFKPRFVLIKRTDTIEDWHIFDSERGGTKSLFPDLINTEVTDSARSIGFTDDGFTLGTQGGINASGGAYIYAAFAATTGDAVGIDSLVDTPTNGDPADDTGSGNQVTGNYCTWNPLNKPSAITLSNGNLDCQLGSSSDAVQLSTIGMSSGKWYAEITGVSTTGGFYNAIGLGKEGASGYLGSNAQGWGYHQDGRKIAGGGAASYGASYAQGDVIGVAFDADNGTLTFYKNGSSQGTAYTGLTSGPYFFAVGSSQTKNVANFGQRSWAYSAPTNFKSLNTANLPTPTIADGSKYFEAKKYDGNGGTQTISNLGFSPDFTWLKKRSGSANHYLYDQVRGATYRLYSDVGLAESTSSTGLTAFTSDGFSLGNANDVNQSSNTYISWNWDAGSSTVTNNDGTIASSVRASAASGFSIVTWTGNGQNNASVGHGLNAAPSIVIIKNRSLVTSFHTYVRELDSTGQYQLYLDGNQASTNFGAPFFNADSTKINLFGGSSAGINASGNFVAWCFAPVAGYSAGLSWSGNGTADGSFIYTGFRPSFIIMKDTNSTNNWQMLDAARDPHNVTVARLFPNQSSAESSSVSNFDFLSNGLKARNQNTTSQSGINYIGFAFAENPFQANGGLAR